jgi:predicted transcriptional regulator
MNRDQLRRAIIDHPNMMKELMLTDWQRRAIQYVNDHQGCCSHDVAKAWDISVPSMSACLRKCFEKGYLTREQMADPTGGYLFVYRAAYPTGGTPFTLEMLHDVLEHNNSLLKGASDE